MRLIDADALIAYIAPWHLRSRYEICLSEDAVVNMINRMPTVLDCINDTTNGDNIRSMTDQELAEWISDHIDCALCKIMFDGDAIHKYTLTCAECEDRWIKWLREPLEYPDNSK